MQGKQQLLETPPHQPSVTQSLFRVRKRWERMTENGYCINYSLGAGEPLYGTAGNYGVFVLVEWNQPFGGYADSDFVAQEFPGEAGERWREIVNVLPEPRLQVIKQPGGVRSGDITVFVGVPREHNPLLYEFRMKSYHEILDLDFPGLLTGEFEYRRFLRQSPLYLVCTNAQRDDCCGRMGVPLYNDLKSYVDDALWQTNHLGGHRFAATMLVLPHGLYYGRLQPEDGRRIVREYRDNRIVLEKYRGRACYTPIQQAGEYFLRQRVGNYLLDAFRLVGNAKEGEHVHTLMFTSTWDSTQHQITIRQIASSFSIPTSCGEMPKNVPMFEVATGRIG